MDNKAGKTQLLEQIAADLSRHQFQRLASWGDGTLTPKFLPAWNGVLLSSIPDKEI